MLDAIFVLNVLCYESALGTLSFLYKELSDYTTILTGNIAPAFQLPLTPSMSVSKESVWHRSLVTIGNDIIYFTNKNILCDVVTTAPPGVESFDRL